MRILLVQSLTELGEKPIFPLGLSYISAHLTDEFTIFDMNTSRAPYEELQSVLAQSQPTIVGVSLRNIKVANPGIHHSCFAPHEKTILTIKTTIPEAVIIVGGASFSLYAEEIMKRLPDIRFGIFGEGEESFPELIRNMEKPQSVKGVYYRENDSIYFTGYRPWIPDNKFNSPNWTAFSMKKYVDVPFAMGVQTKRGCALKCIHCSDRYLMGENIRKRPPREVVEEIEQLIRKSGLKTFSFVDQVFNIPLDHAREICGEIIRKNLRIRWTAWMNERYIDEDFLDLLKEAGCVCLSFSPDSASDKVLKNLHKNFNSKELNRTVELAKKVNIPVEYSFMINAPGETLASFFQTFIFIIKAKWALKGNFKLHNLFMTTPIRIYPHTEIKHIALEEGIIDRQNDLVEPVFYNPPPLKYLVTILDVFFRQIWSLKAMMDKIKGKSQRINF